MVDSNLGETVLDPACGTCGFLVNTIEHIRAKGQVSTVADRETLQNSIKGVEKKPLPHMLATTNMILHRIEYPAIRHDNMLNYSLTSWTQKDRVDVVVTNPPFGGMEEDGIEKNFPASYRTRETSNLFLYLIIHILKDGGRCGMVLPDGFLFGDGVTARIKGKLLETCNLHTIIKLPEGVFAPYSDIQTNLLFFEKGKPTKEVWYFEHPLPEERQKLKNPRYSMSKPIKLEEFELEKGWWNNREENEHAWKVSIDEIKERDYNLDIKNPNTAQEEQLLSSEVIIDKIETNLKNMNELIEHIKSEL
jgi:type I restriction enzyme M protein